MPNKAMSFNMGYSISLNTPEANRFRVPPLKVIFSAFFPGISPSGSFRLVITAKISSPLFVESENASSTFWSLENHFEESAPSLNTPMFFPICTKATVALFVVARIWNEKPSTLERKVESKASAPTLFTVAIFSFFAT